MTDELTRVREQVRRARNWTPDLDVERDVHPLLARGAHAEVVDLVHGLMPGAFLSPSAHTILAAAHEALGEHDLARREQRLARQALAAILDSGDGSVDRPWQVLRVSDEYDVLRSQGRRSVEQRLVTRDGVDLDHHRCEDGSEAWFDVSLLRIRTA